MSCLLAIAATSPLHDETFVKWLLPVLIGGFAAALLVFMVSRKTAPADRSTKHSVFARLVYAAFAASVVLLAATSFGAILRVGHMGGYALAAHTAGAGAFVFLLLPVTWWFLPGAPGVTQAGAYPLRSLAAWLLVISGLAVAGTMFASMLPLLGTPDLLEAVRWHRWAGLLVVVSLLVHAAALLAGRVASDKVSASEAE